MTSAREPLSKNRGSLKHTSGTEPLRLNIGQPLHADAPRERRTALFHGSGGAYAHLWNLSHTSTRRTYAPGPSMEKIARLFIFGNPSCVGYIYQAWSVEARSSFLEDVFELPEGGLLQVSTLRICQIFLDGKLKRDSLLLWRKNLNLGLRDSMNGRELRNESRRGKLCEREC